MRAELDTLLHIQHDNLIKQHGYYQCDQRFYLVQDHYGHGSLLDQLVGHGVKNEYETRQYISDTLAAVNKCHKNGVMHRNLNPTCLLIDKSRDAKGVEKLKVVVSDFTQSAFFEAGQFVEEVVDGRVHYQAPEVMAQKYNEKCDIWSVGIITYQLLCGELPFGLGHLSNVEQIMKVVGAGPKPEFKQTCWKNVSNECKTFIKQCLNPSVATRPSAEAALKSQWFKKKAPSNWRTTKKKKAELEAERQEAVVNLKSFSAKSKLREATKAYKASLATTRYKVAKYEQIFKQLDIDQNGSLSRDEIIQNKDLFILNGSGDIMTEDDIDDFINFADVNKDGVISQQEFIHGATLFEEQLVQKQLREAFDMFDSDNSGYIKADEMLSVLSFMPGFSLEQAQQIIEKHDVNKDGKMDFDEFIQFIVEDESFRY